MKRFFYLGYRIETRQFKSSSIPRYCIIPALGFFLIFICINSVAQKSPINSPDGSYILNDPNDVDKEVKNKFEAYRRWNMSNLYPLACEAKRAGLTVSKKEVDDQEVLIKNMFPGIRGLVIFAENEILAKKYTQSILGIKTTQKDKDEAFKEIMKEFSGENISSKSDMETLIEMRAITNSQITKGEIARINDENVWRDIQSEKETDWWTSKELYIPGDSNLCIAQHSDSSTQCQLTIKKFNRLSRYYKYPKIFPLNETRKRIINDILINVYLISLARQKGFDKTDSASIEINSWLKWSSHNEQFRYLGPEVKDEHILRSIYDQYYHLFFCPQRVSYYSLIGSSDSFYIDSLWKLYVAPVQQNESSKKKDINKKITEPILPWIYSSGPLPAEFDPIVDTLNEMEVSNPFRTPFGFFLVRVDSVKIRHEIPYDEAYSKLVLIATKKKWENLDSALSENAFQIYANRKPDYVLNDTLSLLFLLQPSKIDSININKTLSDSTIKNLVEKNGIAIHSTKLPSDISVSLFNHYKRSNKKNMFIGPILSRYGNCYFKIAGVKEGKGRIPFSQVKYKLIDSLTVCAIDSGDHVAYEKPDSFLVEMALGVVYSAHYFEMDEKTKMDMKKRGTSDPRNKEVSKDYQELRLDEIKAWIKKMKIQIPE